ncbi:MAG: hypothetical protein JXA94_06005 [Parachlamydiales bacterium]|nr:hypothetical protein [Parachlamydiales bacterium]
MKKFSLTLIAFFAMTCVFADSYNSNDSCPPEPCCEPCPPTPCCDVPQAPTMPAYNAPARYNVCGSWDFFVTGTFLWWQAKEQGLEIALIDGATSTEKGQIEDMKFDYKAAFKVGLGYNTNCDDWTTYLQYTRMNITQNKTVTSSNFNSNVDFWVTALGDIQSAAEARWELNHNVFDFELGRPYYSGKDLVFQPFFGIRAGWSDQEYRDIATAVDTTQQEVNVKSDSWLVGPRVGVNSNWYFIDEFGLIGNAALSVFYQKFNKLTLKEFDVATPNTFDKYYEDSIQTINSSIELLFGLGYGTYFDHNNWHFNIFAGYEAQIYFNQNMLRFYNEITDGAPVVKPNNLIFHGLNVTARFDF